ncbi:uncharacterized protein Z518_09557 [Rhinocladiella mackenziei CBS 650.93]|uniref:Post-SET domain-containing protein n=1 Tax=Rhinocladiella mackenziei CBS 650.93 TaxID=1442369 RepID=A0A0D2IYX1_9EURO|nr:uncharacterized protein Z518_09557 [Rhinocladiella mackenziei CBS 650.93]KIX01830.1 hypothetical protein Z518_09557 [Rhinocladiella mackenziei CBS 650.93]
MSTETAFQSPTHPSVMNVIRRPGSFESYSISVVTLAPGALMARLTSPPMTLTATQRWSSVQVSETQHVELNCDFLYVNHSCEPSLEFHVIPDCDEPVIEIRVATRHDEAGHPKGLSPGDELTFFYPSTEWVMNQPFQCRCGTRSCQGRISGSRDMSSEQLRGYFLNAHIEDLRSIPREGKDKGEGRAKPGGW